MKQRLVVMNGQRIVETAQESNGSFVNAKYDVIGKANGLKPGLYNLYAAAKPDKSQATEGLILHADRESVYQGKGKNIIKHDRADFDKVPEIGSSLSVSYNDQGRAAVTKSIQQSRSLSR